jgi:hypothetical protein
MKSGNYGKKLLIAFAALAFAFPSIAIAASHALIMAIDAYEGPSPLPGVAHDVPLAVEMARRIGVPKENILLSRNKSLTLPGMRFTLIRFLSQVNVGDEAFVYYSGHGARENNPNTPSGCTEAMVTLNGDLLLDTEIARWLSSVGQKANKLIFMNDSCFSGGAVTRGPNKYPEYQPKLYKPGNSTECSDPVNFKALFKKPDSVGTNAVYIAASREDELSFAGPRGSVGTLAWLACLTRGSNSILNGDQLRACAQARIDEDRRFPRQRITVLGNNRVPLSFLPPVDENRRHERAFYWRVIRFALVNRYNGQRIAYRHDLAPQTETRLRRSFRRVIRPC